MRIAIIHPFLYRYSRGIERFTIDLANTVVKSGVEVDILTWRWPQPVFIERIDPRVTVRIIPLPRYYAARVAIPAYLWYLLKHDYDFVWVFFAGYGEAEALRVAACFQAIKYGIILHYPFAQVPHRYIELKRHDFARRAQVIVATSEFVANGVAESLGVDSVVISSAVKPEQFRPDRAMRDEQRAELGISADEQVLLTVAALEERKGVQQVIAALPGVFRAFPNSRYLVIGEGPYRQVLENQIRTLGLDARVQLIGATDNIVPFYNSADVFLLLAHGEASPLAPLEAMSMELPLVVSRQRPFDEFVEPAYGVLVEENDSGLVAEEIGALLADPSRRQAMGRAGRQMVLKRFTWEQVAQELLKASSLA